VRRVDGRKEERRGRQVGGTVKVKWVVSFISCTDDMRQTIRGLRFAQNASGGRARDTPSVRGMIHKVRHLVEVVE